MIRLLAVLVFGGITAHAQIGIWPTTTLTLDHRLGTRSNVWKTSSGMSPTSGGIVFGFFTAPFYSNELFGSSLINHDIFFVNEILTNYNFYGSSRGEALYNMGFRDFRSFSEYGVGVQTSGDWSFSSNQTNDAGPSGNISARTELDFTFSSSLSGTRLYEIAFGFGEWNSETNDIRDATFGGDNWGIVSPTGHYWDTTQNYEFPSSGGTKTFWFEALQAGSSSPDFVGTNLEYTPYYYGTLNNVLMIPEPSALSLLAVGLGALTMMRRRRS
jgi:hypothetical protein